VAAGRNLQLQLMPSNEEVLGTYLFSRYLLPSMYLSGDLVDYFAIDDTHMGFYLADVSGHGVSSAFVTVLLKSLVDRHVERCQADGDRLALDPAALLGRLNTDLLAQRLDKYTTLFYGIVDTAQNHLTFCNGGHFPMPVIVDGNSARFLDHRGYPVGLLPRAPETPSGGAVLGRRPGCAPAVQTGGQADPAARRGAPGGAWRLRTAGHARPGARRRVSG
jgi:serine phosphatase RsbU (regulator of sigma subunit)